MKGRQAGMAVRGRILQLTDAAKPRKVHLVLPEGGGVNGIGRRLEHPCMVPL